MAVPEKRDCRTGNKGCREGRIMCNVSFKTLVVGLCLIIGSSFPTYGASTHRWAWGEQTVNNAGGDSRLNVWKPDPKPGVFSLSQHWYVGGSGESTQTVEGGWQVYPSKYGTSN